MKKTLIAALGAVMLITLAYSNPPSNMQSGNGTLESDCSVCTIPGYIHLTGSGYPPGNHILLQVEEPNGYGYINPYFIDADSNGNFSAFYTLFNRDPDGLWTFCTSDYRGGNNWKRAIADACLSLTTSH